MPLDVSTLDVHGLSSSAGSVDQSCCSSAGLASGYLLGSAPIAMSKETGAGLALQLGRLSSNPTVRGSEGRMVSSHMRELLRRRDMR